MENKFIKVVSTAAAHICFVLILVAVIASLAGLAAMVLRLAPILVFL